jgi:hypothetical protein
LLLQARFLLPLVELCGVVSVLQRLHARAPCSKA